MKREYEFKAASPDAAAEMREILNGLPFNMDDVSEIHVSLEVAEAALPDDQATFDDIEYPEPEPEDSDVEYGPVPRDSDPYSEKGRSSSGPKEHYAGPLAVGGVMPDTDRAAILRELDGRWMTSREVADELDDMNGNVASAHLSALFLDLGYVKRRGDSPMEYTLDRDGKEALRIGRQKYEESLEDEEVLNNHLDSI